MLRLTGVAGVGAIAGCSGDGGDGGDGGSDGGDGGDGGSDGGDGGSTPTDTGGDGGDGGSTPTDTGSDGGSSEIVDKDWVYPIGRDPSKLDWNPYNETVGPFFAGEMWQSQLAGFNTATAEYEPHVASDWSIDGDGMTVTLNENFTWHNGDPVTVDDIIAQWELDRHFNGPGSGVWGSVDTVEKVGDYEMELTWAGEVNPNIVSVNVLGTVLQIHEPTYRPYIESLKDAQGSQSLEDAYETDAHQSARTELSEFKPAAPDDDIIFSGPYQVVDQDNQRVVMELYEDHPYSVKNDGMLNFKRVIALRTSDDTRTSAWASDKFDGRENNVPSSRQLPPEVNDKLIRSGVALNMGNGIRINHGNEWLNNRAVRQALTYVINREQATQNVKLQNPTTEHIAPDYVTYITGYSSGDPNELWLGEGYQNEYRAYEQDFEKAASLLEGEGFSKQNGSWVTPDGEEWSPLIGATAGLSPMMDTVNANINEFGIRATYQLYDGTTYNEKLSSGEIDIGRRWWGWGQGSHPFYTLYTLWGPWEREDYRVLHDGKTVEVPMPIGDFTGELQEMDPWQIAQDIQTTADPEKGRELIRKLVWISNVDIPMIPIYERIFQEGYMGPPEWELASDDESLWNYRRFSVRWMFKKGGIGAPTE